MGRASSSLLRPLLNPLFRSSLLCFLTAALAQPASLPFSDCSSGDALPSALKVNVSTVYGQIVTDNFLGKHLNLTVLGDTGQTIIPISNDTGLLATLFTTSTVLTFSIWDNSTFFCSSLRPPSPIPPLDPTSTTLYCPLAAGPLAFSAAIPFGDHDFELFTINTRLRVVDTSEPAIELACVDVAATPLVRGPVGGSIYGHAALVFWVSVALTIGYWAVVGLARIVAAWGRGGSRSGHGLWSRLESTGFIFASAVSGERLAATPALMRFGTPSMRDIIFHTQWCASLAMVAVQWPVFVYPFLAETAWSTLSYNITLTQGADTIEERYNPLRVQTYDPPSNFADQLADSLSPIFIDTTAPNTLFMLPPNVASGIASFAATVGLHPQDLFGICLSLFLIIIAGTITISMIIWGIDLVVFSILGKGMRGSIASSSPYLPNGKDLGDKQGVSPDDDGPTTRTSGHFLFRSSSLPLPSVLSRSRWRHHIRPNSFHGSILHGNLVRILILFHLPVTIFSCYQFTNARSQSSLASAVLAAFSFAVFSLTIPIWLIVRLTTTATSKLYDETRTLLMLGPLYNHYSHGSQLFACLFFATSLVYGITIGCGQKSGTAQAIILLVVEVASALGTSIWLPWGHGASMGLISFFFCVARIIIAVLLVILTPVVSVGDAAGAWVASAILFILGLIYLGFLLILIIKILEALIRIIAGIPFHRSMHNLDSGFFGVLGLVGCCGPKRRRHHRTQNRNRHSDTTRSGSSTFDPQHFTATKPSTPRSSTIGPPSVLRPEHALRPYREDSDDESGYIMGAWQPFPRPGYNSLVDDTPRSPVEQPVPKSGFARVGGGRAHFDSPYAITAGPKQQFPSIEQNLHNSATSRTSTPSTAHRPEIVSNTSTISVNHQVSSGLPPGAMSPAAPFGHIRTKSQTAIIEDASAFFNLEASGSSNNVIQESGTLEPLMPPHLAVNDDSLEAAHPRRKHWFNIRKNRRMSEGDYNVPESIRPIEGNSGRSFVVLRDKRPSPLSKLDASKLDPTTTNPDPNGRSSFHVLRGGGFTEGGLKESAEIPIRPPAIPRRSSRRLSHT